jgi:hypothetical protein
VWITSLKDMNLTTLCKFISRPNTCILYLHTYISVYLPPYYLVVLPVSLSAARDIYPKTMMLYDKLLISVTPTVSIQQLFMC